MAHCLLHLVQLCMRELLLHFVPQTYPLPHVLESRILERYQLLFLPKLDLLWLLPPAVEIELGAEQLVNTGSLRKLGPVVFRWFGISDGHYVILLFFCKFDSVVCMCYI